MRQFKEYLRGGPSSIILLVSFCLLALFQFPTAAAQSAGDSPIYLDQGWSQADRAMFYQISQGSRAIGYDIFLNLEVAAGQELFRSNKNSERYGLIPQPINQQTNPDGLPIGITKSAITEGRWAGPPPGRSDVRGLPHRAGDI